MPKFQYQATPAGDLIEIASGKTLKMEQYEVTKGMGSHGKNNLLIATVNGKELQIPRKFIDEEAFSLGAWDPEGGKKNSHGGGRPSEKKERKKYTRKSKPQNNNGAASLAAAADIYVAKIDSGTAEINRLKLVVNEIEKDLDRPCRYPEVKI